MNTEQVRILLNDNPRAILVAPTGWGKTRLLHQTVLDTLAHGGNIAYVTAFRSAAQEMVSRWQPDLGNEVALHTTDQHNPDNLSALRVTVPEKLDAWTFPTARAEHLRWMKTLALVVIDEAHVLGQDSRGATLEMAVARLSLKPHMRLIMASATIPNLEELAGWLDALPVRIDEPPRLVWEYDVSAESHDKHIISLVTANAHRSMIVFRNTRAAAELTTALLNEQGLDAVAHHAGVPQKRRTDIENGFRQRRISIIVATTTLGAGVNLNPDIALIGDEHGPDGRWRSVSEIQQAAGRAGRNPSQMGIVLVARRQEDEDQPRWETQPAESIQSTLGDPQNYATHLIRQTCLDLPSPERLHTVLDRTLAAYQDCLPRLGTLLERLQERDLLTLTTGGSDRVPVGWKPTALGRSAARQGLNLDDLDMLQPLREAKNWTHFDILMHVLALRSAPARWPSNRLVGDMADQFGAIPSRILDMTPTDNPSPALQTLPWRRQAALLRGALCLVTNKAAWGLTESDLARLKAHVSRIMAFMRAQRRQYGHMLSLLQSPISFAENESVPNYVVGLLELLSTEEKS